MRLRVWVCTWLVCYSIGWAADQKTRVPIRPSANVEPLASAISALSVTPATLTFTSNDPDLSPVAANSTATATWRLTGGNRNRTWTIAIAAGAATLVNCSTVPVSAVTAACQSATITNGSGNPQSATCATGSFPLSTSAQTMASGTEGTSGTFTVVLKFTLTDNWRYPANPSCQASLTYTVNMP